MDFEIEGDDDSYDYDWGNDNKKVPPVQPKKSSTSFFGGDSRADEESAYDFSYQNEAPAKKKYEPFSPVANSYDAKQPTGNTQQKAVAAPALSAMERAQSMLNKYSGKNTSAPPSNFRNQKVRTFNEDEISMSSTDEEPSDFEMSESDDSPVKKKKGPAKKVKDTKHAKKGKDINALDSKATVVVSMGAGEEDEDYLSEEGSPVIPPPVRQISRFSNMDDDETKGDENEYSGDQFDQDDNASASYEESAEEVGESTRMSQTVDTEDVDESRQEQDHSRSQDQDKDQDRSGSSRSRSRSGSEDSTRPSSPEPSRNRADLSNSNSFSPGFDNNTSYSRIGYGNEVDESMEDEDEEVEMSGSSKLKVFSFAELRTWEEKDKENQSNNSTGTAGVGGEARAKSAEELSRAILDMSSHIISAPSPQKPLHSVSASVKAGAAADKSAAGATTMTTTSNVSHLAPTRSLTPPRAPAPAAPHITSTGSVPVAVPTSYSSTAASAAVPQPLVQSSSATSGLPVQYPGAPVPAPVPNAPLPAAHAANQYYTAPPPAAVAVDPNAVAPTGTAAATAPAAPGGAFPPGASHYNPYPYPYPPLPPSPYGYYPYAPPQMPPMHSSMHPPMHPGAHTAEPYPYPPGAYSPAAYSSAPAGMYSRQDMSASWAYPPRRSFESWDPRWSCDAPPMAYPGLGKPSALDPRARMSASSSYGGVSLPSPTPNPVYSDHNLAQQPLVLDLLKELRKSKEEADWAKQKLAETIVRLGDSSLDPPREKNFSAAGAAIAKPARHVHHADEQQHSTPLKSSPTGAASSLVSPVQPVRSAMRYPAAASATQPSSRPETNLEDSELPEEYSESEGSSSAYSDDDSYDNYSDDFEGESPSKTHSSSSAAAHTSKHSKHTHEQQQPQKQVGGDRGKEKVKELLSADQVRAQENVSSLLRDRERVLNPMKESLAHSLLASQELFKSQLESLRARIAATNDYTNIMQQRVNNQWDEINGRPHTRTSLSDVLEGLGGGSGSQQSMHPVDPLRDTADFARTSFSTAPSLAQIQEEFADKRVRSTEKLFDLLVQIYPNMTVAEARRLAAKF